MEESAVTRLTIYGTENIFGFDVLADRQSLERDLPAALEKGNVMLTLTDGNTLILSAVNCLAIEIGNADTPLTE